MSERIIPVFNLEKIEITEVASMARANLVRDLDRLPNHARTIDFRLKLGERFRERVDYFDAIFEDNLSLRAFLERTDSTMILTKKKVWNFSKFSIEKSFIFLNATGLQYKPRGREESDFTKLDLDGMRIMTRMDAGLLYAFSATNYEQFLKKMLDQI